MNPTENKSNLQSTAKTVGMLSIVPTPEEQIDRVLDFLAQLALEQAREILLCQEQQSTAG